VSTPAAFAAIAALGLLAGRLTARPTIRRLAAQITDLHTDVQVLEMLLRTAWRKAHHDQLTGLPNRSLAAIMFLHRERLSRPTTVALIDLDRFKQVNDTYGHHVGDDLLRLVGERLAAAAKHYRGTAARLAGDEFLLLLPAADSGHAQPVAQILTHLAEPVTLHADDRDITVHPTASAGIAVYDGTDGTFDTLLHRADIALYHAKQHHNTHRTYDSQMRMPRNPGRHGLRLRDRHPATHDRASAEEATS
jgi:diguanylate cyclase (GGDEF)-like protein